jgi:predicted DNA-binding protein
MNIQFVRLELDVCERLNQLAQEQRRTVSELTNELLRSQLVQLGMLPPETASSR